MWLCSRVEPKYNNNLLLINFKVKKEIRTNLQPFFLSIRTHILIGGNWVTSTHKQ